MPKVLNKTKALQGHVFQYEGKEGWYYRELIQGTKRYRVKRIPDAESVDDALTNAYKALVELSAAPVNAVKAQKNPSPKRKQTTLKEHVKDYIEWSEKRVDAGYKADNAHQRRVITLRKHLPAYLDSVGIEYATGIQVTSFDDYPMFRKGIAKNTVKTELKEIGIFIRHWLCRHGYLSNEIAMSPYLIPKISIGEEDLDANPAMSEHDWGIIFKHICGEWSQETPSLKEYYFKKYFQAFVLTLKNSGMRPKELLMTRLKDVTITSKPFEVMGEKHVHNHLYATIFVRKSKTGKSRDVVCVGNTGEVLNQFIKFQIESLGRIRSGIKLTEETLLFGAPHQLMEKTYSHRYLNSIWRQIISKVKPELLGNRFSEKEYTIYSCRSTFIENCIVDGIDIYTVARLCGNSVKTIQRFYDRHDIVKRKDDIQSAGKGKKQEATATEFKLSDLL